MINHQNNSAAGHDMPCVDIVVCVHNALDDVKRCLNSLILTDYPNEKLRFIYIDDGSSSETADFLFDFSKQNPRSLLDRVSHATGYTRAANRGVRLSNADIVCLLNSDTIVPPPWLKKLVHFFHCDPFLGLVGPLSNAATWQSVPNVIGPDGRFAINSLPAGYDVETMDQKIEQATKKIVVTPRVPLLNGFCMAVRRSVFDKIGYFDEDAFPRGYGEENDFCFRATNAGYGIALACNTYVFHAKSKSYGSKVRDELSKQAGQALRAKHPKFRITNAVETLRNNTILRDVRSAIADAF